MTRASTVGPEPPRWPADWSVLGCKKCAAQSKRGGVQLTSSRSSGKWPGLPSATGSGGARGTCDPPARASSSAGARLTRGRASLLRERRARGESPGRGAKFSRGCRRVGLRSVRARRAGLRPPRPRVALARRQERAQRRRGLGRGHASREEAGPPSASL